MELKLTNVARASLEELLVDYQDYLRVRDLPLWDKSSPEAHYVRKLGKQPTENFKTYRHFIDTRPPEVLANIAICIIHQTNYLIDQQIRRQEKDLLQKGGLRGRMTRPASTNGKSSSLNLANRSTEKTDTRFIFFSCSRLVR